MLSIVFAFWQHDKETGTSKGSDEENGTEKVEDPYGEYQTYDEMNGSNSHVQQQQHENGHNTFHSSGNHLDDALSHARSRANSLMARARSASVSVAEAIVVTHENVESMI